MIDGLKPYPAYKVASLAGLGEIPSHWSERRAKYLFREVDERSKTGQEELLSVSHITGVTPRSQKNVTMFMAESTVGYKACRKGDLVVNTMWAWMGALGVSPVAGLVSPAYGVYRPNGAIPVSSEFMEQLLRSPQYVAEYMSLSTGIQSSRLRLYPEQLLRIPVLLPPVDEQRSIERFIAEADRRIRRYIRTKQKLIKLLEEQKQAIIHRAVTRGLQPDVRLKPSGTEWLGQVPVHWEVLKIGYFSKVGNGSTPSRGNSKYWGGGRYPWLNSSHANHESVTESDQFVTDDALRECHLPIVPPGSVLVAITGQGATRGKAAVLRFEATINQHIAYITPRAAMVSGDFLRLALHGAYRELRAMSDDSGSTKGALTCTDLKQFKIAFPPVNEQTKVVAAVERETLATRTTITSALREITLLREYGTRLIADVVTGKLDVREAAARLPAEAAESEPLDADALTEGDDESESTDLDEDPAEAEA